MLTILYSYSLNDGASSFAKQAHNVTFDLTNDDGKTLRKSNQQTWDKKKKKFVRGDGVGADNVKMVRTENGTRLPASFRSGRFDEWKSKSRVSLPRIGEAENTSHLRKTPGDRRFKHHKTEDAKPLDKRNTDYERKSRLLKKKAEANEADNKTPPAGKSKKPAPRGTKHYSRVKSELKTSEQIRKDRKIMERRKAKNARPSRKKGKH